VPRIWEYLDSIINVGEGDKEVPVDINVDYLLELTQQTALLLENIEHCDIPS